MGGWMAVLPTFTCFVWFGQMTRGHIFCILASSREALSQDAEIFDVTVMPQVAVLEESSKSFETASDFWVGVFFDKLLSDHVPIGTIAARAKLTGSV